MDKGMNKVYLFKYFYALIMFLGILMFPFLVSTFQNEYNKVLEKYDEAVTFALSEDFVLTSAEKNKILNLQEEVDNAKILQNYKVFNAFMLIVIFLGLFNYLYIHIGVKYGVLKNSINMRLNRRLLIISIIVEIVYFIGLLIFANGDFIGINFWTLFYINIVLVILSVVVALQVQYLFRPKTENNE